MYILEAETTEDTKFFHSGYTDFVFSVPSLCALWLNSLEFEDNYLGLKTKELLNKSRNLQLETK